MGWGNDMPLVETPRRAPGCAAGTAAAAQVPRPAHNEAADLVGVRLTLRPREGRAMVAGRVDTLCGHLRSGSISIIYALKASYFPRVLDVDNRQR